MTEDPLVACGPLRLDVGEDGHVVGALLTDSGLAAATWTPAAWCALQAELAGAARELLDEPGGPASARDFADLLYPGEADGVSPAPREGQVGAWYRCGALAVRVVPHKRHRRGGLEVGWAAAPGRPVEPVIRVELVDWLLWVAGLGGVEPSGVGMLFARELVAPHLCGRWDALRRRVVRRSLAVVRGEGEGDGVPAGDVALYEPEGGPGEEPC